MDIFMNTKASDRSIHSIHPRDVTTDPKCEAQENLVKNHKTSSIDKVHTFKNESKTGMALAWAGENDGNLIVVTTEEKKDENGVQPNSAVFKTSDYGVTYKNLTKDLNVTGIIKRHNGLYRNPHDPKKVYLVGQGMFIYITEDGGETFKHVTLPFSASDEFIFHTSPDYNHYLMAKDTKKNLYMSKNNGRDWNKIHDASVDKVFWGVIPDKKGSEGPKLADTSETIYITYGDNIVEDSFIQQFFGLVPVRDYTLAKSTDGGKSYKDILKNVVSFERQGKFLYASQIKDTVDQYGWRHLLISTDGGNTFQEAQLPTIEPDRFYSVMDIEDDMIFMHVDNQDDSGHGTLYTSANQGVVYSESLPRHLYPNYGDIHDFYKVQSLRGVYITSQMGEDDSIHTMITFNRGGEWQKIPRPDGVPCKDETKACNLHLHGLYSMKRGINALPPISEKTAVGLILAHGHVADALQKTPPDVFVSRDGGYTWSLSLEGPHHYQIGDHGGLLAAVSKSSLNPNIVKFSLDEGRCWHEYKFTDKILNFTGLLTEPSGKSSVIMLWGFVHETKKWEVHVIDFKDVINRQCGKGDYEGWKAHAQHRKEEGVDISGCLLGIKEQFERLKKDAWCYNGYDHVVVNTTEKCTCTREDYECDYGYFRPGGSDECIEEKDFKGPEIDICLRGHDEKLVSMGYRKIPGDQCVNGFHPTSKVIDLGIVCDEFSKNVVKGDEGLSGSTQQPGENDTGVKKFSRGIKVLAIIIAAGVFLLIAIMSVFLGRKFILLRRHKTEYRYSMLSQSEQQNLMGNADDDDGHGSLSQDLDRAFDSTKYHDSDEELNTSSRPSSTRQNGSVNKKSSLSKTKDTNPFGTPRDDTNPFGSYHDDSDDDMLS
ncbi:Sortilin [Mactra antiquata]